MPQLVIDFVILDEASHNDGVALLDDVPKQGLEPRVDVIEVLTGGQHALAAGVVPGLLLVEAYRGVVEHRVEQPHVLEEMFIELGEHLARGELALGAPLGYLAAGLGRLSQGELPHLKRQGRDAF